jgi:hypothetical protein
MYIFYSLENYVLGILQNSNFEACNSLKVEGEDEVAEGEMGRKKMKRFQLPNLPRWWQAKIIQYA